MDGLDGSVKCVSRHGIGSSPVTQRNGSGGRFVDVAVAKQHFRDRSNAGLARLRLW